MNRFHQPVAATLLMLMSVSGVTASPDTQNEVAEHSAPRETVDERSAWYLPHFPVPDYGVTAVDTDPQTRGIANKRLIDRLSLTANQVAGADRVHLTFSPNQAILEPEMVEHLERLAASAKDGDRFVVTGYADQANELTSGTQVARKRAVAVGDVLAVTRADIPVTLDSTPFWLGGDDSARRVEVYLLRQHRVGELGQ